MFTAHRHLVWTQQSEHQMASDCCTEPFFQYFMLGFLIWRGVAYWNTNSDRHTIRVALIRVYCSADDERESAAPLRMHPGVGDTFPGPSDLGALTPAEARRVF